MGKQLIVAEKPSVARDIGRVLGCRSNKDGYMESGKYLVTYAIGHLIALWDPEDYDPALKRWNYQTLPIIPEPIRTKPYPKTKKQLDLVGRLMEREDVESLICATDSGREGELIFRYIYGYLGCRKPFYRLWISSMTDEAIRQGFEKLKPGEAYDNLYHSARCRSEADWLVGINATRAFTTRYGDLYSVGRVQTPTLALIVQRQLEIEGFKPEDYYEVEADYGDFKGTWFWKKQSATRMDREEKAREVADRCLGKEVQVLELEKKKNRQPPPFLYDLTELQRDGNKEHGFTAQQVLTIAQELYEKRKLITYPRTDSRFLSDDMKPVAQKTMESINVHPYSKAIGPLLAKGPLKFSKRIVDNGKVTDHHAIIPTNRRPDPGSLPPDLLKIYQLVVKRFIAVFCEPFEFETTKVVMGTEEDTFLSKGKTVLAMGWKGLYQNRNEEGDQLLPPLKKGEKRTIQDCNLLTKQTSPPKPFTEATLLSAMENAGRFVEDEDLKEQLKASGFGTPATRAGIIERLLQVEYIVRKGKALVPTEKGRRLVALVPEELKSPVTTGKWEKGLGRISQGALDPQRFMDSIGRFVRYIVQEAGNPQGR
ncbi:DNA topoisomerase III [Anaerotalea alkaliphila]|uniref:DNA topoisomerase n=1 Tax=Anaerotalea alkaliphila TaxID=2662126 RepID=A0A7X5HVW5_9FIRM|nr:DNA topoisomerase III [Anaerotalea alkaliphila]NDL67615.1 DNA topoisomerase III [Anaerotalea alkaliphila]